MKRLIVFLGGFGSGKTECAVNYAIQCSHEGHHVALADMDIVNPMFRTTFFADALEEAGVDLIASESMRTFEGLPIVPEQIRGLFYDDHDVVVFDVGGDEIGSIALGQFHALFKMPSIEKTALFVCNTCRPAQDTAKRIAVLFDTVCRAGRIEVDGFVNNTNLGTEASAEDLEQGYHVISELAADLDIPILFTAGTGEVLANFREKYRDSFKGEPMVLQPRPRLPWTV